MAEPVQNILDTTSYSNIVADRLLLFTAVSVFMAEGPEKVCVCVCVCVCELK
jgi:hypothetical protein